MTRISLLIAAAAIVGFSGAASAQGSSEPGIERYLDNPGYQQRLGDMPPGCDGAGDGPGAQGAFGFFGKGSPGAVESKPTGPTGQEHGTAMAAVCGNKGGESQID